LYARSFSFFVIGFGFGRKGGLWNQAEGLSDPHKWEAVTGLEERKRN
jgi:hypothetical protein